MATAAGPKGVKEEVEEDAAELQFPPGKLWKCLRMWAAVV